MVKFSKIRQSEAPSPIRATGKLTVRMRQYEEYVNLVGPNEAGRLTPEEGETTRGVSLRISRAAKRLDKTADTWIRDGSVYFIVA